MVKPASTDFLLPLWQRLGFDSRESFERTYNSINAIYKQWARIESLANKIEYLTGYTLDDILEKVAAGYRLEFEKPPNIEFSETTKLADLVIGEED